MSDLFFVDNNLSFSSQGLRKAQLQPTETVRQAYNLQCIRINVV